MDGIEIGDEVKPEAGGEKFGLVKIGGSGENVGAPLAVAAKRRLETGSVGIR